MSNQDKKRSRAIVLKETGRTSSHPPSIAPHDFGIDRDWYEANKSKYEDQIEDYFTYGDPVGFGGNKDVDVDEDEGLYVEDEEWKVFVPALVNLVPNCSLSLKLNGPKH